MLYEDELEELSLEARANLERAVHEHVVVVRHPMLPGGYDVWWRQDFLDFKQYSPQLTASFDCESATIATAWEYLELVERQHWKRESEPMFTVWPLQFYDPVEFFEE